MLRLQVKGKGNHFLRDCCIVHSWPFYRVLLRNAVRLFFYNTNKVRFSQVLRTTDTPGLSCRQMDSDTYVDLHSGDRTKDNSELCFSLEA